MSTRPRRRCWRACPASTRRSPTTSSRSATRTARSRARAALKKVPRLGPKAFEQAAGFLRIMNAQEPARRLGRASRGLRRRRADRGERTGRPVKAMIGDRGVPASRCSPAEFADAQFGVPTVTDILVGTREARPRSAPRVQDGDVPGRRREDHRSEARHEARRRRDQRHQLRRLRRRRRAPGRPRAHLGAGRPLRARTRTRW